MLWSEMHTAKPTTGGAAARLYLSAHSGSCAGLKEKTAASQEIAVISHSLFASTPSQPSDFLPPACRHPVGHHHRWHALGHLRHC